MDVVNNEANVWTPEFNSVVSSDTKRVEESQVADAGQTVFILSTFIYAPNTGSLAVYKNGLLQKIKIDWNELSAARFALTVGATAGDNITAVGFTAITGTVEPDPTNPTFASVTIDHDTDVAQNGSVTINYGTTDLIPTVAHTFTDASGAKGFSWSTIGTLDAVNVFSYLDEFMTLPTQLASYAGADDSIAATKGYVDSVAAPGGAGPFIADAGTEAAVAFGFTGDLGTGGFSSAPGAYSISVAGNIAITWSAFGTALVLPLDCGNNIIQNVLDPTVDGEVGDRGFNDARYVGVNGDENIAGEKTFTDTNTNVENLVALGNVASGSIVAGDGNFAGIGAFGILIDSGIPIGAGGGDAAWGTITGALSAQTDLNIALNGKVNNAGNENIAGQKTFTDTNTNVQNLVATVNIAAGVLASGNGNYAAIGALGILVDSGIPIGGGGPGVAVAGGHIISNGAGAQDIANCFGVSSVTISGSQFLIVLSAAVSGTESMILTTGAGAGVGTRADTLDQTSTAGITYNMVLNDNPIVDSGAQFHFNVLDAGV